MTSIQALSTSSSVTLNRIGMLPPDGMRAASNVVQLPLPPNDLRMRTSKASPLPTFESVRSNSISSALDGPETYESPTSSHLTFLASIHRRRNVTARDTKAETNAVIKVCQKSMRPIIPPTLVIGA